MYPTRQEEERGYAGRGCAPRPAARVSASQATRGPWTCCGSGRTPRARPLFPQAAQPGRARGCEQGVERGRRPPASVREREERRHAAATPPQGLTESLLHFPFGDRSNGDPEDVPPKQAKRGK